MKYLPIPGKENTLSTTKEPHKIEAVKGPKYVNTGIKAFLKACLNKILLAGTPFALAVLI